MAIQFMSSLRRLREADRGHRPELVLVQAGDALRPGIDLREFLREDEAVEEGLAPLGDRRGPGGVISAMPTRFAHL